ncbi:putative lipoprotein (plasmid) [Borrelia turicatae 91E135]|uniref:Lipoprotein n=2 Tax=Borrelia turicatae TaxID=142 RepID=A0ABF7R0D1_BORT9|nr:putative lipoprotein [Borrelia turicatae 91E135]
MISQEGDMKRSILSVCMLTLLCLLSCDINALNELLDKAREKFLDESKDNKDLNHKQENQEDKEEQADIIDDLEVIPGMEVIPVDSLVSVNAEVSVILEPIYYSQVKREIKEEDLVPSTECEKEAEKAIKDIENAIGSSGFSSLIENAHNMRGKYGQMRTELQDLYVKIQDEKKLLGTDFKNNREKRKGLSRLEGQLKEEIFNVENIMSKIDIAIGEIESAKALFEQAQKL